MTAVIVGLSVALDGVALLLAVPALVLFVQVLAARRNPRFDPLAAAGARPRIGVLMPAHNEAAGIAVALASVRAQLEPGDRLLVVADNCDDATAAVAVAAGAEVVERHDSTRRGKGYALDHGVRHFAAAAAAAPVEVVVIVDADCELHPGALGNVARLAAATGRPAQALYLMRSPEGAGVGQRVAEFAWRVRNQVRPLGSRALGWPCQLMGTGMAFPWAVIASAPLASGHLVEDMELGLALAAAGTPPVFCPSALVTSRFAREAAAGRTQRTRWEHGHLAIIVGRVGPLLARGLWRGPPSLVAMALDLAVPPLASFALMQSAVLLIAAAWALGTGVTAPFWIAFAAACALGTAIAIAWHRYARDLIGAAECAAIPAYVLGKLPIYLKWFTGRQRDWVRTERDGPPKK